MKSRYLLLFSYIGTHFKGAAKDFFKAKTLAVDNESIQGRMELALRKLKRFTYPSSIVLSSRTDAGVHAVSNTAHIDLETSSSDVYDSEHIRNVFQDYFKQNELAINVHNVFRVPLGFHARYHALSRTYVYRFATPNKSREIDRSTLLPPIEEWNRCTFFRNDSFDIEKFATTAKLFCGFHDFTTFKKFDKSTERRNNRRTLLSVKVRPGRPLTASRSNEFNRFYDYWEFEVKGRGFVHNQIRRMIGVLKAVATDHISHKDVLMMLQIPSKNSWPSRACCATPGGLYLHSVEYDTEQFNPQESYNTTRPIVSKEPTIGEED